MSEQPEVIAKPKPEEYKQFLSGLRLLDIELVECVMDAKADVPKSSIARPFKIDTDSSFEVRDDGDVNVYHTYNLKGLEGRKSVVKIKAVYRLWFKSEMPFTDSFFSIYRDLNLSIHTWPYMRELVSSLTSRTNLPRQTLPLKI
ncbi:MAG: hypothetical protein ACYC64_19450 [Armatimonadota bacterium]